MAEVLLSKTIKRYGETQVIHGIDLEINDGEFCVLSVHRAVENQPFCA